MPVTAKFLCAGGSHAGRKRENNEDRFHSDPDRGIFFVVDGMGGHAAGEKAAEIASDVLRTRLERQSGSAADRIREGIALANNEIYRLSRSTPAWEGMACVLTVAVVEEGRATIGHVGDSRLYLLRVGEIRKVTPDHSPVGEMEDRRELTERQAMSHPRRNEVYRDVGSAEHGPEDEDFIDVLEIPFLPDCALLLCSDGLSDLLSAEEIRQLIERYAGEPHRAVGALIDAANRAGGKDNISVVVVQGSEYAPDPGFDGSRAVSEPARWFANRWAFLIYGILLSALLWILFSPRAPQTEKLIRAGPATWTVGEAESADAASISAALAEAQPGDTILVAPGQYREQVHLREGVNLISERPQGAVIDAAGKGFAVLADQLKSGRLSGFRIFGGVDLKDSRIELDEVAVSGAPTAGVEIRGDSAPVLRASQIVDNLGSGVVVRDNATPRLAHNLIARNGRERWNRRPGIEIHDPARPVLIGNTIVENGAEPIWTTHSGDPGLLLGQNFFGVAEKGAAKRKVRVFPE